MSLNNCNIIGPTLPPQSANKLQVLNSEDSDEEFGPALPPGFQNVKPVIGPTFPQNFINEESENEDDIVGPVPEGQTDKNHLYDASKRKLKPNEKKSAREKWMLEPPKVLSNVLQTKSTTKFSQKSKSDKKVVLTEEQKLELDAIDEKETKMKEFLNKYEKDNKRNISLLEQHREEFKNKKPRFEKEERREFDRDKDLNVPKMDSKRKNTFINEASSTFGSRFSKGRFEKFL